LPEAERRFSIPFSQTSPNFISKKSIKIYKKKKKKKQKREGNKTKTNTPRPPPFPKPNFGKNTKIF